MISQHVSACAIALLVSTDHLRVTNERIVEVLRFAMERSATFRQLVAAIDTSGRVVYIEEGMCRSGTVRSCVQLIADGPYMRVLVDPRGPITGVARQLAHEFQHVLEIARSDATHTSAIRNLYERIGFQSCSPFADCYETRGALEVESLVSREVSSGRVLSMNRAYFGTWVLDFDQSWFPACPLSAGRRFDVDQGHGLASAVVESVDCAGVEHRDAFVYKADGKDYPMTPGGDRPSRTIAVTTVDDTTMAFVVKADGMVVACGRRTVAADGTFTTIDTQTFVERKALRSVEVWRNTK